MIVQGESTLYEKKQLQLLVTALSQQERQARLELVTLSLGS